MARRRDGEKSVKDYIQSNNSPLFSGNSACFYVFVSVTNHTCM